MRLTPLAHLVFALLLAALFYTSFEAYRWKQVADLRGWQAEVVYSYLAQPVGKDKDGKPVSRAMLLDALFEQVTRK